MDFRKEVNEVFTPRRAEVNEQMYVQRPTLERNLIRAIMGSKHAILFGESGNGKSWLYKHVFVREKIPFVVANGGNASRLQSITEEISNAIFKEGNATKVGYNETKSAKISAVIAEGELSHEGHYEIKEKDLLLASFEQFNSQKKGLTGVVVLDNLETIYLTKERMQELADIIILLDDSRYAKFNIKILIVGVPNDVLAYFSKTKNLESVSNRIDEIEKVDGLSKDQVLSLVSKGFVGLLRAKITSSQTVKLSEHIYNITMGIAQHVHEYCECLAYKIEDDGWGYNDSLKTNADMDWANRGLRSSYQLVETKLNSRGSSISRKNQVILSIGTITSHQFDAAVIESKIRKLFPETVPATNMGIGTILNELSSDPNPLLRRV